MISRRNLGSLVAFLLILAASWLLTRPSEDVAPRKTSASPTIELSRAALAFERKESRVWIEDEGTVESLLRDDDEGARHQKFIVRISGGTTLLVSHNIDLAPRVPVEKGDVLSFRGEYIWNEKGGLVHWTHDDPQRKRAGGWIEHSGRRYR